MSKSSHCRADLNCEIAYGAPAALGIPEALTEHDDGSVSGPVERVATYMLLHGYDISQFAVRS